MLITLSSHSDFIYNSKRFPLLPWGNKTNMLFKLCILKRLCTLKAQYIVSYCGHREKIMKHDILKSLLNISKFHGHLHKAPHSEGPYS